MFYPITLGDGTPAFEAAVQIQINLSAQCAQNAHFCTQLEYQLVTDEDPKNPGQVVPYPYADNPGLFPPNVFDISGNNGRSNYWVSYREVSCASGPPPCADPCEGLNEQRVTNNSQSPFIPAVWLVGNDDNSGTGLPGSFPSTSDMADRTKEIYRHAKNESRISPNPFSNRVSVSFAGETFMQWYDSQGRLIANKAVDAAAITENSEKVFHTEQWAPGVYYLQIQTEQGSQVHKLVKLE